MAAIAIKGVVFSGMGMGAYFMSLEWVRKECEEKLGFIPFPGTLNVRVKEGHEVLKELLKEGIRVVPPTREFCEGRCYPCSISHVKAAIVFPLASGFTDKLHGEDVIEIVAPVKLKDALSLADGDEIVITVERPWKT